MPRQYERPIVTEAEAVTASPHVIPRFRPTPIPIPSIFDEPTYCLKINKSWMAHLSGVVAALDQPDTWIGTEEEVFNTRNMIREWLIAAYKGTMCEPTNSCHDLQPSAPNIVYFPQNPFTQPDYVPDGYDSTPFDLIQDESLATIGLHAGDVVSFFDSAPNLITAIATGLPSITVYVEGKVEVELHLLNVPQGGLGLITVDDDPLKTYIITMQSMSVTQISTILDILQSFVGDIPAVELFAETIQEFTFDTEGTHKIEVRLLPFVEVADEALINLGIGGGIRKVTVCSMVDPECCDDLNENQQTANDLLREIRDMLRGGITGTFRFDGSIAPPDVAAGACAPDHFDHDGEDEDETALAQREKALCITVERYIKAVLVKMLLDMNAPQFLIDWVGSFFAPVVPSALLNLTIVYPNNFIGLNIFFDAVTNSIDLTALACAMIDALKGDKNNTFVNFRDSLATFEAPPFTYGDFVTLVNAANGVKLNYVKFNEALDAANEEDLSAYECPCAPPPPTCEDELEIIVHMPDGDGTTITYLGDNRYRFQQSTLVIPEYVVAFKDANGKCLHVAIDPLGETLGTVYGHNITGCTGVSEDCDSEDHAGAGGFAPRTGTIFAWQDQEPINTVFLITCCVDAP